MEIGSLRVVSSANSDSQISSPLAKPFVFQGQILQPSATPHQEWLAAAMAVPARFWPAYEVRTHPNIFLTPPNRSEQVLTRSEHIPNDIKEFQLRSEHSELFRTVT